MNKEQVYDNQISPLMQQIITVCKEQGIAMMAILTSPMKRKAQTVRTAPALCAAPC